MVCSRQLRVVIWFHLLISLWPPPPSTFQSILDQQRVSGCGQWAHQPSSTKCLRLTSTFQVRVRRAIAIANRGIFFVQGVSGSNASIRPSIGFYWRKCPQPLPESTLFHTSLAERTGVPRSIRHPPHLCLAQGSFDPCCHESRSLSALASAR